MSLSRRAFIESATLSALLAQTQAAEKDPKTGMPMRTLGKTGQNVSLLGFGAGSRWLMYKKVEDAHAALDKALKAGVNYVDSAHSYGDGESETRIGSFLKGRRRDFFLVTKISARKGDDAKRQVELSLKRLGQDRVDLIHIHSLGNEADLAEIEAKGNVLDVLRSMKEQKVCRFIGITCHTDPAVLRTALERHPFDSTQMALNIAKMGNAAPSSVPGQGATGKLGFESIAMPVALKKGMGLTAMKVFAQEKLVGKAPVETLLRYALSLPVAAAVVGMPQVDHIETNLQVAKAFQPMKKEDMERLSNDMATQWKASIDRFFTGHVDA